VSSLINLLPESVSYSLRRTRFRITQRDRFQKFQKLREGLSPEGYTLKPFEDYGCIFIHVPKCAGQSIRASLFENLQPGHINVYTYQLIYPKRIFDSYFKFTFVRNPWDRLVSAYLFMRAGGAHKKDQEWAQAHLADYPDFASFVQEGLQRKEILSWPHFRPQVQFLKGQQGRIEMDFIGRFENIQEDFRYIADHLGIPGELLFINKTKTKRNPYQAYYSDDLREIAARVYREDIKAFHYQF
jgi:hypothetical protein